MGARSIPACAGETFESWPEARPTPVYPRVCGGNLRRCRCRRWPAGLSPRVRGKPVDLAVAPARGRSIPACAGETRRRRRPILPEKVYPRVCGGNTSTPARCPSPRGLSPRVRGKRRSNTLREAAERSIPACAGETRSTPARWAIIWVYPRVCGGNRTSRRAAGWSRGLSPRVRGKLETLRLEDEWEGSIPACAGETPGAQTPAAGGRVYPRVCGGNRAAAAHRPALWGLSPRVRGKP